MINRLCVLLAYSLNRFFLREAGGVTGCLGDPVMKRVLK